MRVPVYPEDLLRTGGFKRLAKTLQKKWCGSKHLTLFDEFALEGTFAQPSR
ncbi:hypothetical protein BIKONL_002739 [Pseudomonas putida]